MNNFKKFTNIMFSVLLVITIILTSLSGVIRFVATNKVIYLKLLEDSNTYSNVEQTLGNKMAAILGNDISENLKKSIITEEDIRKEADAVLNCIISDLISGQANIPEIDTTVYKERVADALNSLTGLEFNVNSNKNLFSNNQISDVCLTPINVLGKSDELNGGNMLKIESLNNRSYSNYTIVNMASRAELEARGRAMLEERGMTEEEARRKAAERGISEQDVWNYLQENGYLDEEPSNGQSSSDESYQLDTSNTSNTSNSYEDSVDSSVTDDSQNSDTNNKESNAVISNNNDENDDAKVSKKKIQEIVSTVLMDDSTSFDEKVNEISSKLMEEAEKIINSEMGKLNFSNIVASNEFKIAIKITSILYKYFYVLLALLAVICGAIIFINKDSIVDGVMIIGKSIFVSGIIMSLIFGSIYLSKVYTNIDINLNKAYFESMFLESAEYFTRLLSTISIFILLIGLITNIFMMKKKLTGR